MSLSLRSVKDTVIANSISVISWPVCSLDPIENLWYAMKKKVGEHYYSGLDKLYKVTELAWYSTPPEFYRVLVQSMNKCCRAAIYDLQPVKFESFLSLRKLVDNFNFRALTAMGQPTDKWNTPMICTLTSKLDQISKREWEQLIAEDDIESITVKQLTDFLPRRCQLLEAIDNKTKVFSRPIETFRRDNEGRFELSLPLKDNVATLGDSLGTAISRFELLEKRFERDPNFKEKYVEFIEEYERLNHMSQIDVSKDNTNTVKYYLPHHGVIKESSTNVVFDASCKTTFGLSLNDIFMVGPTIQRDLFSIALKFRKHNVAFTSDIEKMCRQCNIMAKQRDLQRIVWRSKKNEELKHFRLNTITYGTASSSYLACRVLYQVAIENENEFPEASNVIKNDFYMDDLLSGAEHVQNALKLKDEISRNICRLLNVEGGRRKRERGERRRLRDVKLRKVRRTAGGISAAANEFLMTPDN
ncbi:hypothetical protein Trydic_g4164 [Trypoxylus dichotomus]